jgi:maleamate amidohydrolase
MSGTTKDLDADYAAAGFDGKLAFGRRPALLIVDVVMAYLDPASPLYAGVETALASSIRLIDAARDASVPVVFTRVVYVAGGADGGLFYRKVPALKAYLEGSPLGDFAPGIAPLADEVVITKQYASAFFGTSLASTLRAMGVDTVVMGGFSTSGCVRASALDALQHGFAPFVVREACGDRDPRPHEASLFDLQAKYAEVVGEAEAIGLMQWRATDPAATSA